MAKDDDDDETPAARGSTPPNIYLDLNTTFATIPANTLALGVGHGPLLSRLSLSSPSAVGVSVNAPLTVDIDDRISLFAGVSGSATRPDNASWTPFEVNGWLLGFQADLHQQNGGAFPTVTLQSTLSGPTSSGPLAVTSLDSNLEFNYALDADETRGWLAGVRYTSIMVDSSLASVDSPVTAYLGGYYQWPNQWKVSARAGMQHFGGAHVGAADPDQAVHPAGAALRSGPDGRQRQPAVRRLGADRLDADRVLLAGAAHAALRGAKLIHAASSAGTGSAVTDLIFSIAKREVTFFSGTALISFL